MPAVHNLKFKKGFTLLELLVVLTLIAILASIILASLSGARGRGRDARRAADIKQIQQAEENYFENNSVYICPPSTLYPTYLSSSPKDPSTGAEYGCAVTSSPASYCIGANFETGISGTLSPNANCINGYNYSIKGP